MDIEAQSHLQGMGMRPPKRSKKYQFTTSHEKKTVWKKSEIFLEMANSVPRKINLIFLNLNCCNKSTEYVWIQHIQSARLKNPATCFQHEITSVLVAPTIWYLWVQACKKRTGSRKLLMMDTDYCPVFNIRVFFLKPSKHRTLAEFYLFLPSPKGKDSNELIYGLMKRRMSSNILTWDGSGSIKIKLLFVGWSSSTAR